MDCKRFRKYVGAFADGELDVEHNLDALEHLNMCPNCATRVAEVSTLKESLQRTCEDVKASQHLRMKIETMIHEGERGTPTHVGRPRQILRVFVPLAAVASLLLVVGLWRLSPEPLSPLLEAADLPASLVADARHQHRACIRERGENHYDPALPRAANAIATILARDLGMRVAVPQLDHAGYKLIGVDRCGVGRWRGSHALYRSVGRPNGELSLFTISSEAALASAQVGVDGEHIKITAADLRLAVVAWNDGSQTYMACAEVPSDALRHLVATFRSELAAAQMAPPAVLAAIK